MDKEFLLINGWTEAPAVNFDLFEEYRLFRLQRILKYVRNRSRFYNRHLKRSIKVGTVADLGLLPLTCAHDVASDPYAFLCIPQSRVERAVTFMSSGTIGPQKRVFFSESDIEAIIDYMAAGMRTVADGDDVVQIMLPGGPTYSQADLLARGVKRMGALPLFTGMNVSPGGQVEAIIKNRSTILFGETHLIYRMTKLMEKKHRLNELGVKVLFLSTSHASPAMINCLREVWNAEVSTHYGLTEMGLGLAVDCPICGERHFNELDVIGEVIDPETGETLSPGSTGELVFTSIQREAMPFIRYRTRDVAHLGKANGMCGSALRTIGQVPYRLESVVSLRNGVCVHPTIFHEVLFHIHDVIDYELTLTIKDGGDILVFDVEAEGPNELLRQHIIREIKDAPFLQDLRLSGVRVQVKFKDPGQLEQGAHFKKLIKDMRPLPQH